MGEKPWRDEETLRELYLGEDMSQAEIGDKLGCNQKTVGRWMMKHEIPINDARGKGDLTGSDTPATFESRSARYGSPSYEFARDSSGDVQKKVRIHRLVAVTEYGFDAVADMDVHHKNEIPWDNRPDNLELLTRSDHKTRHIEMERE